MILKKLKSKYVKGPVHHNHGYIFRPTFVQYFRKLINTTHHNKIKEEKTCMVMCISNIKLNRGKNKFH